MGHRAGLLILSALLGLISLQASIASALGLGEITLKSNLNQPLSAEIELLEVRDLTSREILVGLATQEDFDRVGVERNYFLTGLNFKVDLYGTGGPKILVTSRKAVREPYLNFVVLAHWPSGKLLREYTVLMDLPLFSDAPAAPVSTVQTQTFNGESAAQTKARSSSEIANPRSAFEGTRSSTAVSSSGSSANNVDYAGGETYAVQANDTLWEIALAVRPDRGLSVHQTMLAIQESNPNAFIKNNINLLKKGQILRIPTRDSIESINQRQAAAEVVAQTRQWNGASPATSTTADAPLDGAASGAPNDSVDEDIEGRVRFTAPGDASQSSEGSTGGGADNASTEAIEAELSATLEELDLSKRETTELRSKVASLEEQITTMERMIAVGNEELRALELSAQKNQEAAEKAAMAAKIAEAEAEAQDVETEASDVESSAVMTPVDDGATSDEEGAVVDETSDVAAMQEQGFDDSERAVVDEQPVATPTVAPTVTPTQKATAKPAVKPAPKPKGLSDILIGNIFYIALVVIALIGGVAFFLKKRSESEFDEDDEFDALADFDDGIDDIETDAELDLGDYQEPIVENEPAEAFIQNDVDVDVDVDVDDEESVTTDPETEDVVAEADIYIAYGKYEQAEEMLVKALDRDPVFHEARLKLLETYAAQQDISAFDNHFAKIIAAGLSEVTSRAESLRETIADAPPFNTGSYDTTEFEALLDDSVSAVEGDSEALSGYELNSELSDDTLAASDDEFDLEGLDIPVSDLATPDIDDDISLEHAASADFGEGDELGLDLAGIDLDDGGLDDDMTVDLDLSPESTDDSTALDLDGLELDLPGDDADDLDLDLGGLDLDGGVDDESIDLDLSLDVNNDDLDSFSVDDLDTGSLGDLDESIDLDLSEDLALDDALDLAGADESVSLDLEQGLAGLDDLGSLDELTDDADSGRSPEVAEASDELDLSDLDLDLDDDLDVGAAAQESEQAEAPESDSVEDDLDLSTEDFDLSAIDDELDALSKDLGDDLDFDDLEMDDDSLSIGATDALPDPVTDFDAELSEDLDIDLEEGLGDIAKDRVTPAPVAEALENVTALSESSDESVTEQAFGQEDTSVDFMLPDIDADDDDFDFLSDSDETATKLDLARAYIDMGDAEGARDILDEIMKEGSAEHKADATALLDKLNA